MNISETHRQFPFKGVKTLISIHSQIMRVLIITLSFALVVLGKKFLVEVETEKSGNGKNDYGGPPRRYGAESKEGL